MQKYIRCYVTNFIIIIIFFLPDDQEGIKCFGSKYFTGSGVLYISAGALQCLSLHFFPELITSFT